MNIRFRNIKRNPENVIISGSASLVENTYRSNSEGNRLKNHSQQVVIERLGKVVWADEDDKSIGIFDSPTRGLVYFDLNMDVFIPVNPSDERLKGTKYQSQPERVHTSFGNTYLFLSEMEKTPFMKVIRKAFPDKRFYKLLLAHLTHDCLKNGSFIKCGEFLSQNWLSYILTDIPTSTLDCDSSYFKELSDDNRKRAFFTTLVSELRKVKPEFGKACYVDSTPLPGEAENNPFNALSSHGSDGAVIQSRLVLILDIQTCIPIWFEIIPANVLDKSTILSITDDVKTTLDIEITMYDLDAGYARKELFDMFHRGNSTFVDENDVVREHTVLVRMPATQGYQRDELYIQCKPNFYRGRFSFDYEHHTFFGERVEVNLFGNPEYAFVFVDKTQAESLLRGWREEHLEEWDAMTDSQQDWQMVKNGFFVLIGNKDQTPKEALVEYRGRAKIESFFRDGKAYLRILPLAKWNKETVKGKIFHDIIETIFYRAYRVQVSGAEMSMSSLLVYMDSWECFKKENGLLELKTPRTQVRELLEKLGYSVPGHIDLNALSDEVLNGVPMAREPVTLRKKRSGSKPSAPLSPEEKKEAKEQDRINRIIEEAERKMERAKARAKRHLDTSSKKAEDKLQKAKEKAKQALSRKLENAKRESTKAKAQQEYDQALLKAQGEFDQAIKEAKVAHEKAVQVAEADYTQAIKEELNSDCDDKP